MLKMICAECGSEDVLADAYVAWDIKKQQWFVTNIFDKGAYCRTCDGECYIDEEMINESSQASCVE